MSYYSKIGFTIILAISLFTLGAKADTLSHFERELDKYKGKVVYLDFWASWCTPCLKSFPWMNEIQQQYSDKSFIVLSVTLTQINLFPLPL